MSQTKLGPTLSVIENEKHESHSFWFEGFKCSLKVDRRKDGESLAVTLQTPDGKVVVSLGPTGKPRFVTQVKHTKQLSQGSECSSSINKNGVKLRFDYEPQE